MLQRSAHRIDCHTNNGFTFVGLLMLVTVIALVTAGSLQFGAVLQRRAAEEELLKIGLEFRNALISYADSTPAGEQPVPRSLQDLLKDPRYPQPRRHLRRLYPDPITGMAEWGLIAAPDRGGIIGIHSLSDARPIKVDRFEEALQSFAGKTSYREWVFAVSPDALRPGTP